VSGTDKAGQTGSLAEGAFRELVRTSAIRSRGPAEVLKHEGLKMAQYNVLCILRWALHEFCCGEIAA
jgi:hypothetical protein